MIIALIVFLLVVIFLAFFIGKNLSNVCNFWFFQSFEDLPVAVLVLIAFGVGIVFSILVFVIAKIRQTTYVEATVEKNKKEKKDNNNTEKLKDKINKKERKFRLSRKPVEKHVSIVKSSDATNGADNK